MPLSFLVSVVNVVVMCLMLVLLSALYEQLDFLLHFEVYHIS